MSHAGTSGEHLVAALGPRLTLALLETGPPSEFELDGVRFRDSGLGDFTGFYDWLRDREGRPVGVRYCPAVSTAAQMSRVAAVPYVRRDGECLEIRFGDRVPIDYAASDDQSFGGNRLFVSDAGGIALSFETYFLAEEELRAIREAQAHWGTLITDVQPR